jgi:hypothetical protein
MWTHVPAHLVQPGTRFLPAPGDEAEIFQVENAWGDIQIPHSGSRTEDVLVFKYHPIEHTNGPRIRKDRTLSYTIDRDEPMAIWVE